MKLENITQITGQIELVSGLHIGGGETSMRIGGTDNTVVRHPRSNAPYIPGSSLKGKIRSLLEWRSGKVREKPLSWSDYECNNKDTEILKIIKLFGISAGDNDNTSEHLLGPTRVSIADCMVNEDCANEVENDFYEIKSENNINRITSTADSPRFIERVQAGIKFDFNIIIRNFEEDKEDLLTTMLEGMRLLELDNLGASGSRGYGKIKFCNVMVNQKLYQEEFEKIEPFSTT